MLVLSVMQVFVHAESFITFSFLWNLLYIIELTSSIGQEASSFLYYYLCCCRTQLSKHLHRNWLLRTCMAMNGTFAILIVVCLLSSIILKASRLEIF